MKKFFVNLARSRKLLPFTSKNLQESPWIVMTIFVLKACAMRFITESKIGMILSKIAHASSAMWRLKITYANYCNSMITYAQQTSANSPMNDQASWHRPCGLSPEWASERMDRVSSWVWEEPELPISPSEDRYDELPLGGM